MKVWSWAWCRSRRRKVWTLGRILERTEKSLSEKRNRIGKLLKEN